MRIRRGPLFWGLLLIPLGAIPLLVRAGTLDASQFGDVGRFWPLVLVGIGLAVLLGRGRASIVGTAIVALTIGTLGGAALAGGGLVVGGITDCAASPNRMLTDSEGGAFTGRASVTLDLDCGSLDLTTSTDAALGWMLEARYRTERPDVSADDSSLRVVAPERGGSHRQEWTLRLPADALETLDVTANAAAATVDLTGTTGVRVQADVNAGDLRLRAGDGGVERLDVSMNAGRARITLGGGETGSLAANAGAIELCVPPDADLRFRLQDQLTFGHNLDDRGLAQAGDTWTRAGSGEAIELDIQGNAASFTLEPEGGC